jgi:hypothetical protein
MSHSTTSLISCPTIQDRLDDYFVKGDPTLILERLPFLEFLTSSDNTNGALQRQISPGNGKVRQVELLYEPRYTEDDVNTSAVQSCTSTNEGGHRSEVYSIDTTSGVEINRRFQLTDLKDICESDGSYIERQIMKMIDAAKRKMATRTWSQVTSMIGQFGPSVTVGDGNIMNVATLTSGGAISTDFIEKISFAALDTAYPTVPYIFGYQKLHNAFKAVKAGCCADSGLNVGQYAQQNDMVFLTDYRSEDALGTDEALMVAGGALQLLTYNEFRGERGIRVIDTEDYKQTVIADPMTGIPFDFIWKFDCGNIYVQIKLAHKLVQIPNDMFFGGDRYEGTTWINNLKVVNP